MTFCKVLKLAGFKTACDDLTENHHLTQQFVGHMNNFGLNYGTHEEFSFRMALFEKKDKIINEHNAKNPSYNLGHNQFSTWTNSEYKKVLGSRPTPDGEPRNEKIFNATDLPDSFDWRAKGAVNPVKDQGHCGSCWAFSSTSALESANFIKNGKLLSLSEKQLVDCNSYSGCSGCNGGYLFQAFNYLKSNA